MYKLQGLDCAKSTAKWKINYDLKINAGHLVCVHGCMCVCERENSVVCNEAGLHMWYYNCWIFVAHIHTHTHMYIYMCIYMKILYLTLHRNIYPNPLHIYIYIWVFFPNHCAWIFFNQINNNIGASKKQVKLTLTLGLKMHWHFKISIFSLLTFVHITIPIGIMNSSKKKSVIFSIPMHKLP